MTVIGIAGWKNSGKTLLVERLVAELSSRGLTVSTVKHAHHGFDIDRGGTDSRRHRTAGAREVLVCSSKRWALIHEQDSTEPKLDELLARMSPADCVLVEGFKRGAHPKIETRRLAAPGPNLAAGDPAIIAIATDRIGGNAGLPEFDLNDAAAIAGWLIEEFKLGRGKNPAGR